MALEATHLQFALDMQERYQVSDVRAYLSGAIYPDSRYVSGIDRYLTHGRDVIEKSLASEDFKKGWLSHLLCDEIGKEIMLVELPEIFVNAGPSGQGSKKWKIATAVKIIQDIQIFSEFNIQEYLSGLEYIETPNKEPKEVILKYAIGIQSLYLNKTSLELEDKKNLWLSWGVEKHTVDEIIHIAKEFLQDAMLVQKIHSLYKKTTDRALVIESI